MNKTNLTFLLILKLIEDGFNSVADRLPIPMRKRLCWLLNHKYKIVWFKSDDPDAQAGFADSEHGCVFCGKPEKNILYINPEEIDYDKTLHRTKPTC